MNKRKLQLDRTTLRQLQADDLANVQGGDGTIVFIQHTHPCLAPNPRGPTDVMSIGTSGPSVINPSGGIVIRQG